MQPYLTASGRVSGTGQQNARITHASSDLFERRRRLMADWATYLGEARGAVISLSHCVGRRAARPVRLPPVVGGGPSCESFIGGFPPNEDRLSIEWSVTRVNIVAPGPDGILLRMSQGQPSDTDTTIAAKVRWGWVSASIPIHVGYLWQFLKDGALRFAGRETDPLFVALPLAALAFGLLGWGVRPGNHVLADQGCRAVCLLGSECATDAARPSDGGAANGGGGR